MVAWGALQSEANLNGVENGIEDLDISGNGAKKSILDSQRAVTGVLTSRPTSRDIKIDGFSLSLNGVELIQDCSIELTIGRRYGLIGSNGSGKTNFLQCLAGREVRYSAFSPSFPQGSNLNCISRTPSIRFASEQVYKSGFLSSCVHAPDGMRWGPSCVPSR